MHFAVDPPAAVATSRLTSVAAATTVIVSAFFITAVLAKSVSSPDVTQLRQAGARTYFSVPPAPGLPAEIMLL